MNASSLPASVAAVPTTGAPPTFALARVLDMGESDVRIGAVIGGAIALLLHGYMVVRLVTALTAMHAWVVEARSEMHEFFWTTYDIETDKKPDETPKKEEPPPPEPEPEPPPKEAPKAVLPPPEDIYKEKPPQAADAQKIVTAAADAQKPETFDDPYQSGDNTGPGSKYALAGGDPNAKGDSPNARANGAKETHGTDPNGSDKPLPPKVDMSKPPSLVGSTSWNCPFPPEADAEGRDRATAVIVVTVRPDGSPQSVSVMQDPGSGFGRAARSCALGRRFKAGLDRDGNPTTATTQPIRVNFSR
ncbi:MAG TPA: energy transducer TonB [Polyangiaceae bacterium]|jgi:protein TonB|nr:energy transducer TonB [Polyangiaceae bacterium]